MAREIERLRVGDELRASLATRTELGEEFEPQIVESFLEKLDVAIEKRVDERLGELAEVAGRDSRDASDVAIWSLGLGIPLTGAAGGTAGFAGIVMAWVGIVLVNLAYALSRLLRR